MDTLEGIISRKARLVERIGQQRRVLAIEVQDLQPLFSAADRATAIVQTLRRHPGWLAAGAGLLLMLRPQRSLAWVRRGLIAWRTWKWARSSLGI